MFIFFIFLLSFSLSINCMEKPPKRGLQDSLANTSNKGPRTSYYGLPTLEGIPDDIKVAILEYVLFANAISAEATTEAQPDAQTVVVGPKETLEDVYFNHVLKKGHSCFFINKKFAQLSHRARLALLPRLEGRCPSQFIKAVNQAATSPARCTFLQRMIQASQNTIFNVTRRLTPLMIAVGYDNEEGVKLLLDEAKKRRILQAYVNLDCGENHNYCDFGKLINDLPYTFECQVNGTALHIACNEENAASTSTHILKTLLKSGANPNAQDKDGYTPLGHAISLSDNAIQQIVRTSFLLKAGADQTIPTIDEVSPEEINDGEISEDCPAIYKKQRAAIQSLFKKYSKSE